jgi:4-carboxymuconolactone decarboxylase
LNRSALTIKDRQLATLGIVIAQGSPLSTVRQHLKVCAYVGWTRNELTEVLIQLTGYIGWPLVLAITRTALDVFAEMTDEDFFRASSLGEAIEPNVVAQTREHGLSAFAVPAYIADISPLVDHYLDDLGIAKTRLQSAEQAKAACLTDIACLTCLAHSADTAVLSAHVKQALTLGASNGEIVDAMMKALPHAGVLAVQAALLIANRVIEKTGCFSKETAQHR